MERNVATVQASEALHQAARELAERSVAMARVLLGAEIEPPTVARGGRKASERAMAAAAAASEAGSDG
jgi:hypothetical protein